VVSLIIALAAVLGLLVAQPSLVPVSLRQLVGLGPKRLADVPEASGSGSFAFLAHQPGDPGSPVGYDPCREIDVVVNPEGGPRDGVAIVRDAMSEIGRLSGLVFHYDGETTERPSWEGTYLPSFLGHVRTRPVLVSWATSAEVPQLAGDVAGIGGSVPVPEHDGVIRYVTGGVTLDADEFAQLAEDGDGAPFMRAIVLHELGHVVGLAHVDDPRELMYGDNVGMLDFGAGDRLGLATVGSGSCR